MSVIPIDAQLVSDRAELENAFDMAARVLAAHRRGEMTYGVTAWALTEAAERVEHACRHRRSWLDKRRTSAT